MNENASHQLTLDRLKIESNEQRTPKHRTRPTCIYSLRINKTSTVKNITARMLATLKTVGYVHELQVYLQRNTVKIKYA